MITKNDIEFAAERISGRVRRTPIIETERGALGIGEPFTLKLEMLQHTGSFKARGAFNRILSSGSDTTEVIAASGGNAGAAVAYAARELGLHAEIFVPETSPKVKVDRLSRYGASITVTGAFYADAHTASLRRAAETQALVVHAYDQTDVAAGQGTVARELLEQQPKLQTVFVAVGGGGLLAGIGAWLEGRTQVVAVEPESCATLAMALKHGAPVDVEVGGVAADALGARRVSDTSYEIAARDSIISILVSDDEIMAARQALWDEFRVAAEPAGATALAALTSGAYQLQRGERSAVIVCGGNTDTHDLTPTFE